MVSFGGETLAIEVKSGRVKKTGGIVEFMNRFPHARAMVVGSAATNLEDFLSGDVPLF